MALLPFVSRSIHDSDIENKTIRILDNNNVINEGEVWLALNKIIEQ